MLSKQQIPGVLVIALSITMEIVEEKGLVRMSELTGLKRKLKSKEYLEILVMGILWKNSREHQAVIFMGIQSTGQEWHIITLKQDKIKLKTQQM